MESPMYRFTFHIPAHEPPTWTAVLKSSDCRDVLKHLEQHGVHVGVDGADCFAPEPDEFGVITSAIVSNGTDRIGRYTAVPLTKEQAAVASFDPEFDVSDSHLCEEVYQ